MKHKTINKDPRAAYYYVKYARDVIEGRYPEAEETISKDPCAVECYFELCGIWGVRSAIIEEAFLANKGEFDLLKKYVQGIDWSDPVNDFPIPDRIKRCLKRAL